MVTTNDGKPRGYAFIEFATEDDMAIAYKKADGKKIDEKRIVVDVERGRYDMTCYLILHLVY
jgi:U1 small nuclear ribonucleoprotein